jgi:hypothetical protein
MRIMEAVVFLFLMVLIPPMLLHSVSFHTEGMYFLFLSMFGALMFGGFSYARQNVYGFIDDGGIRYKRYFNWKSIKWSEIENISRGPMGTDSYRCGAIQILQSALNIHARYSPVWSSNENLSTSTILEVRRLVRSSFEQNRLTWA